MGSRPGTYALILHSDRNIQVRIGRLGVLALKPGYYLYIGSAFGPGGVRARVGRHCGPVKHRHWHIDYLHEHMTPQTVWYSHDSVRHEHCWADLLAGLDGMTPVEGFGCSDCRCHSHLFHSTSPPELVSFSRLAGTEIKTRACRPAQDCAQPWSV